MSIKITKHLGAVLIEVARMAAGFMSRSLPQQIGHWALIARELMQRPGFMAPAVQAVLKGRGSYDLLNAQEQAFVRAQWAKKIEGTRKNLRLDRILAAQGREVIDLDDQGAVIVRNSRAV